VLPNPVPASGPQLVTTPIITTRAAPESVTLRDSERALILRTLKAVGWVIGGSNGAAIKLGLKRTTLIEKMKRLGIARPAQVNTAEAQIEDSESSMMN
jgi:transcriptional regulator with GAF, ATPase, and Fis domain